MIRIVVGALLSVTIGMGVAFAQAPATAPSTAPAAPAAQPAAPAKMTADQKKAISKSCYDQATAKGLRGKPRKKFHRACVKNGGNAPAQ